MTRRMLLRRQDRGSQDWSVIGQSDTVLSSDWLSLSPALALTDVEILLFLMYA